MFYDELTNDDKKELEKLYDHFDKLLADVDARIEALRPDDPEPDPIEYRRLQESRPPEPQGVSRDSEVYQTYLSERKAINEAVQKLYDDWEAAGSDEWRAARAEKKRLQKERKRALADFEKQVEERYINSLGDDPDVILQDAKKQVNKLIIDKFRGYERDRKKYESFSSKEVRVQANGTILLDYSCMKDQLLAAVARYYEALDSDPAVSEALSIYIDQALSESEYVGDTGELGGEVLKKVYDGELVTQPKDLKYPVDRVTQAFFGGKIDFTGKNKVNLSGNKRKKVSAIVMIDYSDQPAIGDIENLPRFTDMDRIVHNAVITYIQAGVYALSYGMIYRVMSGNMDVDDQVPREMREAIDQAFKKFNGKVTITLEGGDPKNPPKIKNRPIVTYQILENVTINGQEIPYAFVLSRDPAWQPALYSWAVYNGSEIDTVDLKVLDVPGLKNSKSTMILKNVLLWRVRTMNNQTKRSYGGREIAENYRTIRYDYLYEKLSVEKPTADQQRKLRIKINKCLEYWQKLGLLTGYEHKRNNKGAYYEVVLTFKKQKKLDKTG